MAGTAGGSGGERPMRGHVRILAGRRPRPPRDPRPWRRTRLVGGFLGLGPGMETAAELTPRPGAVGTRPGDASLDPRDRYVFPEEFPDGPYGMTPDSVPDMHQTAPGQRGIGRTADAIEIHPYRYDRDYDSVTGTVADQPPPPRPGVAPLLPPDLGEEGDDALNEEPSD